MRGEVTHRRLALALAAALGLSSPAAAVVCSVSPQSVSFGTYDPLSPSALDGVGNIAVSCDAATSFTISLGTGAGSYSGRVMTSGANQLGYNLYTDITRLTVWGDGTGSTSTVSTISTGGDFAVYGRMPAGQNVPAGSYADTIVVTVTY